MQKKFNLNSTRRGRLLDLARLISNLLLLILLFPGIARAEIYSYFDQRKGITIYTNTPPKDSIKAAELSKRPKKGAKQNPKEASAQEAMPFAERDNPNRFDHLITKYGELHQVDVNLIKAVIRAESNFNPRALSRKGAKGLMQLMPETAARYGVRDIYDAEQNIQIGVQHLKYLLDLYNRDLKLSLAAYNAGEKAVQKFQGIPRYKETLDYVKRIIRLYGSELHSYPGNNYAMSYTFYKYIGEDGVLHLTNVDPPSNVKLIK